MRATVLIGAIAVLAASTLAAGPKEEVQSAAKKLAAAGGYAWKTTTENAGGGGMRGGPTEGKMDAQGVTCLSMTRGDNTTEAFLKGEKGAVKTEEGWQSLADLTQGGGGGGGQGNRGQFMGRMLRNYRAPAVEAEDLAGKTKELKKDGDALTGDLTEDGAKSLLLGSWRQGANAPESSGAKGSVKFWLKDGKLVKYQYHVQGKVTFNNNDREVDRTTTVEIKDVGATKFDVPEDAKKKLS